MTRVGFKRRFEIAAVAEIDLGDEFVDQIVGQADTTIECGNEGVGSELVDVAVRIVLVRQERKPDLAPVAYQRQRGFEGAPCSLASGAVAIETEDHRVGHPEQALQVILGGGRPQGGDGVADTGLGEAQIVDALTEQMRDLLVIASAGADTDLLILTAGQKEKAVELAQKFDAAALIYNITALEKLRWAVKNSDTPRKPPDAPVAPAWKSTTMVRARSAPQPKKRVRADLPASS